MPQRSPVNHEAPVARWPAILCALTFLACELISRPYAEMGVSDDWSYARTSQKLLETGHIVYNGWATAMVGWQFYLAAAMFKVFGVSYTAARVPTLVIAAVTAFLLQRVFVRLGLNERNATLATLTFVLSPLYMMLSATMMTDIPGLFALVACLYACVRALQTSDDRAAAAWLACAAIVNAGCGTSRQIAWLGVLVIVPSTAWLLRRNRLALVTGCIATVAGAAFVYACMRWYAHQPYSLHEPLFLPKIKQLYNCFVQLFRGGMEMALLAVPCTVAFVPALRRSSRRVLLVLGLVAVTYTAVAYRWSFGRPDDLVAPNLGDWVTKTTTNRLFLQGDQPVVLHYGFRSCMTALAGICLLSLIAYLATGHKASSTPAVPALPQTLPRKHLLFLLGPVTACYWLLLIPRATILIFDRYFLFPLIVALFFVVFRYQERWNARLPSASVYFVVAMALYGMVCTHNTFSVYRARVVLAQEVRAAGVPDTSVDYGWEENLIVELKQMEYVNEPRLPASQYQRILAPESPCHESWFGYAPNLAARYAVSFEPDLCAGPAPFAPVQYSLWGTTKPHFLYVIQYAPPWKPESAYADPSR